MKAAVVGALVMGSAAAEELRITLYDRANLTKDQALTVRADVSRIFLQSGISVEWIFGSEPAEEESRVFYSATPPKGREQEAYCRARRDVALKILAGPIPGLKNTILGVAHPLAHAGLNVRIFDDRVRVVAERRGRGYATVLAHVIAHEIGHVLLRSSEHTGHGLMANVWSESEYIFMARRALLFPAGSAVAMRETLSGKGCPERTTVMDRSPADNSQRRP